MIAPGQPKGTLYACLPGKGKQPVPARLRASANRANNPLQLTGFNKFNPRASIMFLFYEQLMCPRVSVDAKLFNLFIFRPILIIESLV